MGYFHFHQILLALVASATGAYYLHLLWNIPSSSVFRRSCVGCRWLLSSRRVLSKHRSEFVIEKLDQYGFWFLFVAMVGCFTEDAVAYGNRILLGGSLSHPTPLYDLLAIKCLLQAVKWNDSRLKNILNRKMVAAEQLGGCSTAISS